jgi:hypothetical protein
VIPILYLKYKALDVVVKMLAGFILTMFDRPDDGLKQHHHT